MPEFNKVVEARSAPPSCAFCGAFEGPFIETGADLLGHGLVLICSHDNDRGVGCAEQIGRAGGNMVDAATHTRELGVRDTLRQKVAELENELKTGALQPQAILALVDTRLEEVGAKISTSAAAAVMAAIEEATRVEPREAEQPPAPATKTKTTPSAARAKKS